MHPTACPICTANQKRSSRGNFDYFECDTCQGVYIDSRLVRAPTQLDDYVTLLGAAREMRDKYGWPPTIRFDGVVTCPNKDGCLQTMGGFPAAVEQKAAKLLAALVRRTTHFGEKVTLNNTDYPLAYAKSDREMRALVGHLKQRGHLSSVDSTMHDVTVVVSAEALDASIQSKPAGEVRQMRLLFLAANPTATPPLDLEEELRSLEAELRSVRHRDKIVCRARHAVRPDDLIRHVREDRPNVLHFSGHGAAQGIVLRSDAGGYASVAGGALGRFLEGREVELVVLNSCYSKHQADAIKGSVKAVVGTTAAVEDEAARRFTVAFYRALGNGLPVAEAFRDGRDAVELHGLTDVFHCDGDQDLKLVD